ncbi:MAG: T9SS type A sorting domain-containing protein [Fluviicola sp.]
MKYLLLLFTTAVFSSIGHSQSNTPCGGFFGAPLLTVNSTCIPTNGSSNGASFQNNAANGGTPPCANPGAPDVWYSFVAPAGGDVALQMAAGTMTDGAMALYSGGCPNNFNIIACDDDSGPGLMPQITATGLTPGAIYYIRIWQWGGGTGTFSICLTIPTPLQPNTNCDSPDPICSGTPITFTANTGAPSAQQTNPGNNYGCLAATPNPSWYYLEIDQGGNLVIDVSAGSDVDFAIWGPYPNLTAGVANCGSHGAPQDCSFSTSEVEQVNLPSVNNSEVYVLLVTNYANTIQNITVNNNGGTATTNCGIVPLPIELVSFEAKFDDGNVDLLWETASERENDFFAIERLTDSGIWEVIQIVDGAGTTTETNYYSSKDDSFKDGVNYYRLKQVDYNGTSTISEPVSVNTGRSREILVVPNPAKNTAVLKGIALDDLDRIQAVSLQGRTRKVEYTETSNGVAIDMNNFDSGIYVLQCQLKDGSTEISRITLL